MDEKISIIIPAYNIEQYLGKTLDSVLKQTYPNIEVIVVDDGSRDGTLSVMEAYQLKDSRVHAIHKENGGVTSARLRGVTEASGEWIGFVDGDDYIEPDMYTHLMENAVKYHADISHCGYQMVFPSRIDYYHNTGRILQQEGLQGCRDLISAELVEPGLVTKVFRKELFDGLDTRMDPTIKINEDLLMNYYLFQKSGISVFEDFCPYHYVLRKGSAATSSFNEHKLRDPLRVLHLMEADHLPELEDVLFSRILHQLISDSTLDAGEQADLILPYRAECRQELRWYLRKAFQTPSCSWKLKIMAAWTSIWPWSYAAVHQLYARITGSNRRYEIK